MGSRWQKSKVTGMGWSNSLGVYDSVLVEVSKGKFLTRSLTILSRSGNWILSNEFVQRFPVRNGNLWWIVNLLCILVKLAYFNNLSGFIPYGGVQGQFDFEWRHGQHQLMVGDIPVCLNHLKATFMFWLHNETSLVARLSLQFGYGWYLPGWIKIKSLSSVLKTFMVDDNQNH